MACIGGIWLAAALAASGAQERAGQPSASEEARRILGEDSPSATPGAPAGGGDYQTDLPGGAHRGKPERPPDGDYQTELPRERAPLPRLSLGPLELLLRVLGWVGLGILAVLLVVWLARTSLALWARRRAGDDAAVEDARVPGPVAIPIGDAEAMAARGDYAGAIHALLLRTLETLSRAARLSPALTSREIVARVPLAPRARLALRGLVHAVEVSRFGGAEPGQDEYRACRERFDEFRVTYGAPA